MSWVFFWGVWWSVYIQWGESTFVIEFIRSTWYCMPLGCLWGSQPAFNHNLFVCRNESQKSGFESPKLANIVTSYVNSYLHCSVWVLFWTKWLKRTSIVKTGQVTQSVAFPLRLRRNSDRYMDTTCRKCPQIYGCYVLWILQNGLFCCTGAPEGGMLL
jgi:hypothetical protein